MVGNEERGRAKARDKTSPRAFKMHPWCSMRKRQVTSVLWVLNECRGAGVSFGFGFGFSVANRSKRINSKKQTSD